MPRTLPRKPAAKKKPAHHPHELNLMRVALGFAVAIGTVLWAYGLTQHTEAETPCQASCRQASCSTTSRLPLGLSCDIPAFNACAARCAPAPSASAGVTAPAAPAAARPGVPTIGSLKAEVTQSSANLCQGPVTLTFNGVVFASGPGNMSYMWERSDGQSTSAQTQALGADGSAYLTYGWLASAPGDYWVKLHVTSPNDALSSPIHATVAACPPPPPAPPVVQPPVTPPPVPPPPVQQGITWVNGMTGSINFNSMPPAGWRYDPFGGEWYSIDPQTIKYVFNPIDNYPAQSTAKCGTNCQQCKNMCQVQLNLCNYGAACTKDYNACINVCYTKP